VILPCSDEGVELIARRRRELLALGYASFEANDDVSLAMLDKDKTYALARAADIPTPRTLSLDDESKRAAAVSLLGFPLGLKPKQAHVHVRAGGHAKGFVVHGAHEFARILGEMDRKGVPMLATEIVAGPPDNLMSYYSYIDSNGSPLFHFTKRKLRQFPPLFGTESYGVTHWNYRVAELGNRFFSAIGLRGLAAVEFKLDERDSQLKLIECNYRFTGSHELVRASGIDLAVLAYERALGLPGPPVDMYRDDVRLWYPIHDFHAFVSMRRGGTISPGQWVWSLAHRQLFPVFRVSDPKPTAVDLAWRTRIALHKLRARSSG
jgi:predicted ATP-grasp superfamily ATP-dependent carboligase